MSATFDDDDTAEKIFLSDRNVNQNKCHHAAIIIHK